MIIPVSWRRRGHQAGPELQKIPKGRAYAWKEYEFGYCLNLIRSQGNAAVGRDPKTVAAYLRLQASSATRDGQFEIAARLGAAATCINCDARNNHVPDWVRAERIMIDPIRTAEGTK